MEDFILENWDYPKKIEEKYSHLIDTKFENENNNVKGYLYLFGILGFSESKETALLLFRNIMNQNNLKFLDRILEHTFNFKFQDELRLWFDIYEIKIKSGKATSQDIMYFCRNNPYSYSKEYYDNQIKYLNIVIDKNDIYKKDALYILADIYNHERENIKSKDELIELYKEAGELGNSEAWYEIIGIIKHRNDISAEEYSKIFFECCKKGYEANNYNCKILYIKYLYNNFIKTNNTEDFFEGYKLYKELKGDLPFNSYYSGVYTHYKKIGKRVLDLIQNLKDENDLLKSENNKLKTEIKEISEELAYSPDGMIAQELNKHFEEFKDNQKK